MKISIWREGTAKTVQQLEEGRAGGRPLGPTWVVLEKRKKDGGGLFCSLNCKCSPLLAPSPSGCCGSTHMVCRHQLRVADYRTKVCSRHGKLRVFIHKQALSSSARNEGYGVGTEHLPTFAWLARGDTPDLIFEPTRMAEANRSIAFNEERGRLILFWEASIDVFSKV